MGSKTGSKVVGRRLKKMVTKETETSGQCGELFRREKGRDSQKDGVWGALESKWVGLHRKKIQTKGPGQRQLWRTPKFNT